MFRIGAVRYLNARPLISGLDDEAGVELEVDVPSRLLEALLSGRVHIALCPIIDFQLAPAELCVVPVGAIGSDGPAQTVRLFSRVPLDRVTRVLVDADSHTSVALLQIILAERNGGPPAVERTNLRRHEVGLEDEAVLLIGDKVVTSAPSADLFPHHLDLGQAWKDLTGLPFVFATWMAPAGADLGPLPGLLERLRESNLAALDGVVARHASELGWPPALAREYLGERLCFDLGERQLEAMELFWRRCAGLGLIHRQRSLRTYRRPLAATGAGEGR